MRRFSDMRVGLAGAQMPRGRRRRAARTATPAKSGAVRRSHDSPDRYCWWSPFCVDQVVVRFRRTGVTRRQSRSSLRPTVPPRLVFSHKSASESDSQAAFLETGYRRRRRAEKRSAFRRLPSQPPCSGDKDRRCCLRSGRAAEKSGGVWHRAGETAPGSQCSYSGAGKSRTLDPRRARAARRRSAARRCTISAGSAEPGWCSSTPPERGPPALTGSGPRL